MRLLPLLLLLAFAVSCGKDGSSTSKQEEEAPSLVGMKEADGLGIDLLDTVIDVPVEINDSQIVFRSTKTSYKEGRRITCKTHVNNGEIYRYDLEGDRLRLVTNEGSITMRRLNNEKNGIIGTWTWKGVVNGYLVRKIMSVVGQNRVILKTHCEL